MPASFPSSNTRKRSTAPRALAGPPASPGTSRIGGITLVERMIGMDDLAKKLMTLPFRRRDEPHQRARFQQKSMKREGGDGRRFAGLPGAVEQKVRLPAQQQFALPGIRRELLSAEDERRVKQQGEGAVVFHFISVTRRHHEMRCRL